MSASYAETAAEIAAVSDESRERRYCQMRAATDRALKELEELNEAGVTKMTTTLKRRLLKWLKGLPTSCVEVLPDSFEVQEVLDGLFEVQERLFYWHDPDRLVLLDEPEEEDES